MCKDKVKHLLLLVGSNPLPNAVAGKLLVEPGGTIALIYSENTTSVAESLQRWLKEQGIEAKLAVKVEESNPLSIYQNIHRYLRDTIPENESVGLNYTGGTKMMSVHAYRALERWAKNRGRGAAPPQYSYLDAKTLQMVFDPPESFPSAKRIYVGGGEIISFEALLKLHKRTIDIANREVLLPETAKTLAKYCSEFKEFGKCWNKWISEQVKKLKDKLQPYNNEYLDCAVKEINGESKEKVKEAIMKSLEKLKEELGLGKSDKEISLKQPAFKKNNFTTWLTGKWLEHYVLDVLNSLEIDLNLQERLQSIQTSGKQFELDVAAMRGYQLFGFSCKTISEREKAKLALFEASIRAKQLGGDEARAALVCYFEDPQGLEVEMSQTMDLEGRIKVFGRKHLAELREHIKEWINSQKGEE